MCNRRRQTLRCRRPRRLLGGLRRWPAAPPPGVPARRPRLPCKTPSRQAPADARRASAYRESTRPACRDGHRACAAATISSPLSRGPMSAPAWVRSRSQKISGRPALLTLRNEILVSAYPTYQTNRCLGPSHSTAGAAARADLPGSRSGLPPVADRRSRDTILLQDLNEAVAGWQILWFQRSHQIADRPARIGCAPLELDRRDRSLPGAAVDHDRRQGAADGRKTFHRNLQQAAADHVGAGLSAIR